MNREQAKKFLPLIAALAEGKTIQYKNEDTWVDTSCPAFTSVDEYRVKPEPKITYVTVYTKGHSGEDIAPAFGGCYGNLRLATSNLMPYRGGAVMEMVALEGKPVFLRPLSGK